jgi:hypothetical protein
MTADGSLTLGWTEAELFTALSSNLEQTGDASSGDDSTDASNDGATDGTEGSDDAEGDGTASD